MSWNTGYWNQQCIYVCKDFYVHVISESSTGMVVQNASDSYEFWKYLKQKDYFEEFHPLWDCFEYL
jgi:hypothetical protein